MSDFTTASLPGLVLTGVLVSVIACAVFLIIQSLQKVRHSDDEKSNTTGHVWDDTLREFNNPMPRWWMWLFHICIVFALGYLWMYPGTGGFIGVLDWTSHKQYQAERDAIEQSSKAVYAQFDGMSIEQVAFNPQAIAIGERLFLNNCAQCHGSDARGSKGFPNLTDRDWLYGGTPEAIAASITQGRRGMMPPMMAALGGKEADARAVAQYVLSLSGHDNDPLRAQLGRDKFRSVCAACHGADGTGNVMLGAPNLADAVWLHGGTENAIVETIKKGRSGDMPEHASKLTPGQIRVLSAWVWRQSQPASVKAQFSAMGPVSVLENMALQAEGKQGHREGHNAR